MADLLIRYFAYGSNMDVARLVEARLKPRGVTVSERVCGRLDGWRLAFNKRARGRRSDRVPETSFAPPARACSAP